MTLYNSGYNHPALLQAFDSDSALRALVNRPALGVYPGADWVQQLNDVMLSVAPKGLDQVSLPEILNKKIETSSISSSQVEKWWSIV